jgi:PleD family two-component response regulator
MLLAYYYPVLWWLGQVFKRCLREIDSAYRYGGEEFTIILHTTSVDRSVTGERITTEFNKEKFPRCLVRMGYDNDSFILGP